MHTRRIATFLLGAWLAGSLLFLFVQASGSQSPPLGMARPLAPAAKMIQVLGRENAELLFRHVALEQSRYVARIWERAQVLLALGLGWVLFRGTQRRPFPLFLCGIMLAMVLLEYFALTPEITYQARDADFPSPAARTNTLELLQLTNNVVEGAKLLAGAVLSGFLFYFRSARRESRSVSL